MLREPELVSRYYGRPFSGQESSGLVFGEYVEAIDGWADNTVYIQPKTLEVYPYRDKVAHPLELLPDDHEVRAAIFAAYYHAGIFYLLNEGGAVWKFWMDKDGKYACSTTSIYSRSRIISHIQNLK